MIRPASLAGPCAARAARTGKPGAGRSLSWDALAEIDAFITVAEAELVAMERERTGGIVTLIVIFGI